MSDKENVETLKTQVATLEAQAKVLNEHLNQQAHNLATTKVKAFDMVAKEQTKTENHEAFLNSIAKELNSEPSFEGIFQAIKGLNAGQ